MGIYINPASETKEEFLFREAIPLSKLPKFEEVETGKILVCLVDNGIFTAAGVLYSQREIDAFNSPSDNRPKYFFIIEKSKLRGVVSDQDFNDISK